MSIAMGTRLHINLYIYKTTSVPILVLLSQTAQSYPLAAGLVGEYRVMKWIKKCRPTGRTCLGPQIHNKIAFAASR